MQNAKERSILGIKRSDKINTKTIKEKTQFAWDINQVARRKKWDWVGHLDDKWAYKVMNWYVDGKRSRGRQKARWGGRHFKIYQ